MRTLYMLSFIPIMPLRVVAFLFGAVSCAIDWVAGYIHDETSYRVWLVLHRRACRKAQP